MSKNLDQQAIDVLRKNDRGGFTVPTAKLYPYQWNWDSAFVALGFATFDRERAWQELELLLEGQWENGMVPHIIFRRNDPDYFPGPNVWQTPLSDTGGGKVSSGGISQPPVLSSIVHWLVQQESDEKRATSMFDRLMKWHNWYHTDRTPEGHEFVATVHPWETGRDNCPDWEIGFRNMSIDPDLEPYVRKDIQHIDPSMRPSKEQYDKYLTIIKFGRDHGWDQKQLTNHGPFLMADPCIHFILLRADRDLLELAKRLGRTDAIETIEGWIEKSVKATDAFWNEKIGAFCAFDVRTGEMSDGISNASCLCFYADAGSNEQRERTLANMRRVQNKVKFLMPSWDPDAPLFEPQRYWCGPVWPQMNHIISKGLAEQGEHKMAEDIRLDLKRMIEQSGFYECFNPLTGEGCIGSDFSWTAALWLAWASPENSAVAA